MYAILACFRYILIVFLCQCMILFNFSMSCNLKLVEKFSTDFFEVFSQIFPTNLKKKNNFSIDLGYIYTYICTIMWKRRMCLRLIWNSNTCQAIADSCASLAWQLHFKVGFIGHTYALQIAITENQRNQDRRMSFTKTAAAKGWNVEGSVPLFFLNSTSEFK